MEPVRIGITLTDEKVRLSGVSETNPGRPLSFDYAPPLGTGDGFAGLELLALSFAGCFSTALLVVLRRGGAQIKGFSARVTGLKTEKPLSLAKLVFEAEIESPNLDKTAAEDAVAAARKLSPVLLSLSPAIEVETTVQLRA